MAGSLRWVADALTASRVVVTIALVGGSPGPLAATTLVAWAWVSDAVDGPIARRGGTPGRLGPYDHVVDAAVGTAMLWYLGTVEAVPALGSRLVAAGLLALWAATRVMAAQMLLQALAGGTFLWWAATTPAAPGWLLPLVALALLGAEWRRVATDLVPAFLRGWSALLRGRPDDAP